MEGASELTALTPEAGAGRGGGGAKDSGVTWTSVKDGLTKSPVTSFTVGNGFLYAAINFNGVWYRPLKEMDVGINEQSTFPHYPGRIKIINNSIKLYTLAKMSDVLLRIFDVRGRLVSRKIEKTMPAGEQITQIFDRGATPGS